MKENLQVIHGKKCMGEIVEGEVAMGEKGVQGKMIDMLQEVV